MAHRRFSFSRPAFTIIELLVVISIIAILIALTLVIAGKVSGAGKQKVTEQTLRVLDSALEAYIGAKGGIPPASVSDPRPGGSNYTIPIIDGRNCTSGTPAEYMNSVGLFMLQCKAVPEAQGQLKNLESKIVRDFDPDQSDPTPTSPNFAQQPQLLTAFDGWGNPIRYVHPTFKGIVVKDITQSTPAAVDTQVLLGALQSPRQYGIKFVRRADYSYSPQVTDADGGIPPTNKPYFYSCGPDGDPATIDDNIYTTRPKFPKR